MSKEAVLVVDMLKGFLEPGYPLYCGEGSRNIIPKVVNLLTDKTASGVPLLYLCDNHHPKDPEFSIYPAHCISGTEESRIIDELSPYPGTIIQKSTLSGFYQTGLARRLSEISAQTVSVVGVCTDICVQFVVADLRVRGYQTVVREECVASFNSEGHNHALGYMDTVLGANLIWAN